MKKASKAIKARLISIITEMARSPGLFVKNPGKDFTRKRKLGLDNMLTLLLGMGGGSLRAELLAGRGYAADTATVSAFIQQRDKILPFAFEFLLHEFTRSFSDIKTYKGFRLLAVDGTDLHIATNPNDSDTYFKNLPEKSGFNLLHLNALYDLCNGIYIDALIQGRRIANEHKALTQMVDRSYIHNQTILIADRGYESYNNLAHIERKGWNYLIRIKDRFSSGILSGLSLPESEEFDVDFHRILTHKQTNEVRAQSSLYRRLMPQANFDFLDPFKNVFYPISFRIVRFEIANGAYETVITNLSRNAFPLFELKKLYRLRWGIETSFRTLKYAVGLVCFHSKKAEYISQEIFASLTLYNFSRGIALYAIPRPRNTRYDYQINFSLAIRICRHFFSLS